VYSHFNQPRERRKTMMIMKMMSHQSTWLVSNQVTRASTKQCTHSMRN
jgi:hypothetical protein